jgi:hypothetical protein
LPPRCAAAAAQHRVKLAELSRDDESVASEGANVRGVWRPGRGALAVLVRARGRVLSRTPTLAATR